MSRWARAPRSAATGWFVWLALLALAASASASAEGSAPPDPDGRDSDHVPGQLIVKLKADGPSAVTECAESLNRKGHRFRDATRDRSDSLDRLHSELGVRHVRSLFRRPDARPFQEQRRRLAERLARKGERRSGRTSPAPDLSHVYLLELGEGVALQQALASYRADPHVEYVQPNFRVQAQFTPDDPFFHSSGSWGQPERDLWGLLALEAEAAWDISQGDGVVVAVTDSGLDYDHPDIAENVWINSGEDLNGNGRVDPSDLNGIDDDDNGFIDDLRGFDWANSLDADQDGSYDGPDDVNDPDPFDDHGHGTHVSGTIAAVANNGLGIAGVAPRAKIMALKGLNSKGSGPISQLAEAIVYATMMGADVANNSWSCSARCPVNPVIEEALLAAHSAGMVTVFSAGNKDDDVLHFSPQNMPETLVVSSSSTDDTRSHFSNTGLLIDVAAPGSGVENSHDPLSERNILSLRSSADGTVLFAVGDGYRRNRGTSMSAPHVAGVAALLLAADPGLGPEDVRQIIRQTADDIEAPGFDGLSGAGRVNARRVLEERTNPDVDARITAPFLSEVIDPAEVEYEIRGTAAGPDFDHYQLYFGRGLDPSRWNPIGEPSTEPVDDGVLGVWEVGGFLGGSFALRLTVTDRDGNAVDEFVLVSFERIQAIQISSPGPDALDPAISGTRVVWSSARTEADQEPGAEEPDMNLFVSDIRTGKEKVVTAAPGHQEEPSISGRLIAWRDTQPDAEPTLAACHYQPWRKRCRVGALPAGASQAAPIPSGSWIAWIDEGRGQESLVACRWLKKAGRCGKQRAFGPEERALGFDFSNLQLAWLPEITTQFVASCPLDANTGACEEGPRIDIGFGVHTDLWIAEDIVAWERLDNTTWSYLICHADPETRACAPITVETDLPEDGAALSGNRFVWQATRRGDSLDLFFCEYDRVRRECPAQRLTGSAAVQRNPDIDGTRVVWEDFRNGAWEIFGYELPSLQPIGDRETATGQTLRIPVRGRDASGDPVVLSAEAFGDHPLEELGAVFVDHGDNTGELIWTPDDDQVGTHFVSFELTARSKLSSRETIRIEVK